MRTTEASGIIRTRKRNNYTVVDKTPFEDERLTWAARGLLAYLLTKPDDWRVRVNDLLHKAPMCGRDQLRGILAEIEAYGYLTRERIWNPKTKKIDWETIVHEAPVPADEEKIAKLESRYKRRKKEREQSPEIQSIDQCPEKQSPEIQYIEKQRIEKPSIYQGTESTNSLTNVRERAKRPPRQTNMNSFNEAVQAYKELSGVKSIPPATINQIAETVTDVPFWRTVVPAWVGAGFNPKNVSGQLDWYLHPDKMQRKDYHNGTSNRRIRSYSPPDYERKEWKSDTGDEPA